MEILLKGTHPKKEKEEMARPIQSKWFGIAPVAPGFPPYKPDEFQVSFRLMALDLLMEQYLQHLTEPQQHILLNKQVQQLMSCKILI
jgi:hypothetical protein